MIDLKLQPEIRVKNTPAFKLKDKLGRNYKAIRLVSVFSFVPEVIIIEKVRGRNNVIIVRAVLTEEELKKEEERKKNLEAIVIKKGGDK